MENIFEKSYNYLFLLLVLALPFSMALPNILLIPIILLLIIDYKNIDFSILTSSTLKYIYLLIIYIYIKAFFNNSLSDDQNILSRYFFLLIIPVIILKVNDIKKVKLSIIFSIHTLIIFAFYKMLVYFIHFGNLPLADGLQVNEILPLERPYAGFLSLISIILSFEMFTKFKKNIFLVLMLLPILFIAIISARNSIITLFVLAVVYFLYYFNVTKKVKIISISISIALITLLAVTNKNVLSRFHIEKDINTTISKIVIFEPRYIIWPCGITLTQNDDFNHLTGFESEKAISLKMKSCYSERISNNSRRTWFLERNFNTHNQFLGLYLSSGIIGLTLIFLFFIASFLKERHNFFCAAVLISFFFFFIFENVLSRQFGCYIFAIYMSIFLLKIPEHEKN